MIYEVEESEIKGVYLLQPDFHVDMRGSVTKIFHRKSFEELGLECEWGESLITENFQKDVIRGFHFQRPPYCQAKTLFCVSGSILDAVIDLRKGSETYGKTAVFSLDSQKRTILYVPRGVANCYLIRQDHTVIAYNLTSTYMPAFEGGIRWDSTGVDFGCVAPAITKKDRELPELAGFKSPFVYGENC